MLEINSESKLVVLDFDIPQLLGNKIFNPVEAVKVHYTILPICYLFNEAFKKGIQFVTPDIYLNLKTKPKTALLMSHLITPYTQKLITAGAKPVILTCQESPFYASRFYLNLRKYSGWYKYSFIFSGMKRWLNVRSNYRQMFFPQSYKGLLWEPRNFKQKKFALLVSGARQGKNFKKTLLLKLFYGFGVREINSERRKIVDFFGKNNNLDLYGKGWDKEKFADISQEAIKQSYRGTIQFDKKNEIVANYKFCFCFENAVFPGYVTEKIFDAMAAGVVPIYLGAPDIEKFVPANCFIDATKFRSLVDLHKYLNSINEEEYEKYIQNIKAFFVSDQYQKFSQESFAKEILEILEKEFANA